MKCTISGSKKAEEMRCCIKLHKLRFFPLCMIESRGVKLEEMLPHGTDGK